jgi:serine/threonine-protein kinase
MSLGKFACAAVPGLVGFWQTPKMAGTRIPRALFFAIILAALAQCTHDFPLLPDRLASHFGASGMPNGWMTKTQFIITYALVLLPALFIEFWLHRKISKTPGAKLNLPNREYWLAPERRAETFAYFETFFAWYGCAFLFVVVFAMGLAMRANFDTPPRLPTDPIVSVLSGFVLFNVVAVVAMLRRFSLPI